MSAEDNFLPQGFAKAVLFTHTLFTHFFVDNHFLVFNVFVVNVVNAFSCRY